MKLALVLLTLVGVRAEAAMTVGSLAKALVHGPRNINEYAGTTPGYNSCSASLQITPEGLRGSVSYGDTGASVTAALDRIAQATKSGDVYTVAFASDAYPEDSISLKIQNAKVLSMDVTMHDTILFIPRTSKTTCGNLVEFVPTP